MIKGDMRDKSQNNNKDGVFNNAHSGKPLRYTHDSLTKDLIGKSVTISLIGGRIEAGILKDVRDSECILRNVILGCMRGKYF